MAFSNLQINRLHDKALPPHRIDLRLAEILYGIGVRMKLQAYRQGWKKPHRLPVPVISVGNLTTGGTGKTPVVMALAQHLEESGLRVAVLSRGYGARHKTKYRIASHPDYGDEAFLISQVLQEGRVFIGPDRVYTGQCVIRDFLPDIIVLDDGFQHIRLHRDLNIMLVDGTLGFGNGHLLPAGPLREPLSQLCRADWILTTKAITSDVEATINASLDRFACGKPINIASCPFSPVGLLQGNAPGLLPLDHFANQPLLLVSGIARPESFETTVQNRLRATISRHLAFPDHHDYTAADWSGIKAVLREQPTLMVLTTDKDWVKLRLVLPEDWQSRFYRLEIRPVFDWSRLLAGLSLPVEAG